LDFSKMPLLEPFHRFPRLFAPLGILLVLSACAGRPGPEVLNVVSTKDVRTKEITIYAATTRTKDKGNDNGFSTGRADDLNYAKYTISIPPDHKTSAIEWPKGTPNAKTDFVVTSESTLTAPVFTKDVTAQQGKRRPVGIFVHGYNYTFQESLFRLAQMAADANIDATPILFAWPSQGALTGYVADRESVLYSRDYLASLLVSLSADQSTGDIILFGHSMGGFLIMETARQLKLEGRDDILSRLSIVLAAPDIDADVFRKQMDVIGKMKIPLTLLVSKDDRALAASSFLDANHPRVGRLDINDPQIREAAVKYGIKVIDITSVKGSDGLGHDRFVSLAKLYPQLASLDAPARRGSPGQVGAFIFDTAGATIASPFKLMSRVVDPQ
jgi:esterase/lipase superfamily enzyme